VVVVFSSLQAQPIDTMWHYTLSAKKGKCHLGGVPLPACRYHLVFGLFFATMVEPEQLESELLASTAIIHLFSPGWGVLFHSDQQLGSLSPV